MPATATVKQTSEQLIASAVIAGDNYPAHNRPIVGRSLVSILGRILRIEKKDRDWRLSSLVNIPNIYDADESRKLAYHLGYM